MYALKNEFISTKVSFKNLRYNYLYFSSMQYLSAQSFALLSYIEPVSALFVSVLLLGEKLLPLQIVGAFLVLGGAMLGELVLKPKLYDAGNNRKGFD